MELPASHPRSRSVQLRRAAPRDRDLAQPRSFARPAHRQLSGSARVPVCRPLALALRTAVATADASPLELVDPDRARSRGPGRVADIQHPAETAVMGARSRLWAAGGALRPAIELGEDPTAHLARRARSSARW